MRGGRRVVIDGLRVERSEQTMVHDDVHEGQQERRPVLVEDEDRDDDEEVEVRLDHSARHVDDQRRAGDEAERRRKRSHAAPE
jgi:hypothetical protein